MEMAISKSGILVNGFKKTVDYGTQVISNGTYYKVIGIDPDDFESIGLIDGCRVGGQIIEYKGFFSIFGLFVLGNETNDQKDVIRKASKKK